MKATKVTKKKTFLVLVCPVCASDKIDTGGEGGFSVFSTRAQIIETMQDTDGETLGEKVAYACSSKCGGQYHHRHCKERPCGYCNGKAAKGSLNE